MIITNHNRIVNNNCARTKNTNNSSVNRQVQNNTQVSFNGWQSTLITLLICGAGIFYIEKKLTPDTKQQIEDLEQTSKITTQAGDSLEKTGRPLLDIYNTIEGAKDVFSKSFLREVDSTIPNEVKKPLLKKIPAIIYNLNNLDIKGGQLKKYYDERKAREYQEKVSASAEAMEKKINWYSTQYKWRR